MLRTHFLSVFRQAIIMTIIMAILTGMLYPAIVTVLAQTLFPHQANGSLLFDHNKKIIGSELIGQSFSEPKYFWGRLSATSPYPYSGLASGGSNLSPTNPQLIEQAKLRFTQLNAYPHQGNIPIELLTASASGLDPHISVQAAMIQVPRISQTRSIDKLTIIHLIQTQKFLSNLDNPTNPAADVVNVLALNLALDQLH